MYTSVVFSIHRISHLSVGSTLFSSSLKEIPHPLESFPISLQPQGLSSEGILTIDAMHVF